MAEQRQHAYTTEAEDINPAPETSHAERARTMLSINRVGVLSTQSKKCKGFPFGSTMPYALNDAGRPLFLISAMAMHTKNLQADPRASLFVTVPEAQSDPLGAGRLTLIGNAESVPQSDLAAARAAYLSVHENAKYYVDFADFSFWRLNPIDLYFVGGFGVMGWVDNSDFERAVPDPLAESAPGILEHMNKDHVSAMIEIARHEKGIDASEAKMTAVDRLGFHLRLNTPQRVRSVRIGFSVEVRNSDECRRALVEMVKRARSDNSPGARKQTDSDEPA
jgi:putative heme iron utilization protein